MLWGIKWPAINGLNKRIQDKQFMQIMFPYSEYWIWLPADAAVLQVGVQLGLNTCAKHLR